MGRQSRRGFSTTVSWNNESQVSDHVDDLSHQLGKVKQILLTKKIPRGLGCSILSFFGYCLSLCVSFFFASLGFPSLSLSLWVYQSSSLLWVLSLSLSLCGYISLIQLLRVLYVVCTMKPVYDNELAHIRPSA